MPVLRIIGLGYSEDSDCENDDVSALISGKFEGAF